MPGTQSPETSGAHERTEYFKDGGVRARGPAVDGVLDRAGRVYKVTTKQAIRAGDQETIDE